MKVKIFPYSRKFARKFLKIKEKISRIEKNIDIHHVGSTSVPGLEGKGIIDILIGVKSWKRGKEVVSSLKKMGFSHIHPLQSGRTFVSKQKLTGLGDTHFPIVRIGTKQYSNFLEFRNYLRRNKRERESYIRIKKEILDKVKRDRKKYSQLKGEYIKSVLRKIKK